MQGIKKVAAVLLLVLLLPAASCRSVSASAPAQSGHKKAMVALTFDDGPGYNNASDRILDTLEKYKVRATFFMVGEMAENRPKNLQRKLRLGCELGNHTYRHNHYGSRVTGEDIRTASEAISAACGRRPTAFRAPGGSTNADMLSICAGEGMAVYYWSLDTEDWKYRDANRIYNTVMNNVRDGDIILMHEIYLSTAQAVERLVPALLAKGYRLVTCEELVRSKTGKAPVAGCQYLNGDTVINQPPYE